MPPCAIGFHDINVISDADTHPCYRIYHTQLISWWWYQDAWHPRVWEWPNLIFRVTGPLWRVTRRFDVFFDLRLNKRLRKQSRRRWFEAPSCSLWYHGNALGSLAVYLHSFESFCVVCRNITKTTQHAKMLWSYTNLHDYIFYVIWTNKSVVIWSPFLLMCLYTSITACISNYMPSKVWHGITYPFQTSMAVSIKFGKG